MKHSLLFLTALAASFSSMAQDVGRVISSTPVLTQVAVPRNVCTVQQVAVQQPKSGAGALMGAIAGGAVGNAIGQGGGRAVATMVGLMGGAILGDQIEGPSPAQLQNVQRCTTQTSYENRIIAYNVVYEYAGKRYQVQMPSDPGPTIRLNVSPVGTSVAPAPSVTTVYEEAPRYVAPAQVVLVQPVRQPYPLVMVHDGYRGHRFDYRDDWQDHHRGWNDD